ncbi:MAG: AAA family ATPase [Candidatus Omnitrophica bacterium]|nr:AAA family ATPase [Candidatus Omnitrophota bacterium]
MTTDFSGLKQAPFNITCNPNLFFESVSHKEAYAALLYGIQCKKGIIMITGEVGTGKTTLCKVLLERLDSKTKTSLILNPCFNESELLRAIIEDFGIADVKRSRLQMINQLNSFLVESSAGSGNAVLIIDEAQNLSDRQLEQIRLLSNLETYQHKLLQIVLVGQPELVDKLKKPNLRQIRQRIFVKYNLSPLSRSEIEEYVNIRLQQTENKNIMFYPESYDIIYNFSQGIPRLINMICDRALLFGFVKETDILDKAVLESCLKELI